MAHDRYILDHLPTQVIEVGHGRAERYLGNYEDYLRQKAAAEAAAAQAATRSAPGRKSPPPAGRQARA